MSTVLLIGGTGSIGRRVVPVLLELGHQLPIVSDDFSMTCRIQYLPDENAPGRSDRALSGITDSDAIGRFLPCSPRRDAHRRRG